MAVTISSALANEIVGLAAAAPDVEVCGLLLGTASSIDAILPARNVAAAPATRFEVDPRVLLDAYRTGPHGTVRCRSSAAITRTRRASRGLPQPTPR